MKKDKIIKRIIVLTTIFVIMIVVASIIIKYQVEGETNMPFYLQEIMVISNAQGLQKEETEYKWDLDLIQNNDIFLTIAKNKNYRKTEIIEKIVIDNLQIEQAPQKGIVRVYRPNEKENGTYLNTEEYQIEKGLEYQGGQISDIKNLQIGNQGGRILLRFGNEELGEYVSDEEDEIRHDGTLLGRIGLTKEEIQFSASFDLAIVLQSGITYKANIVLEFPSGDIIQEGTSSFHKKDVRDVVFKRQ